MKGDAPRITHPQSAINKITRQVGSARRIHVHHANVFHAFVMTGCACLNISLAISLVSTSGRGAGAALASLAGAFSTLGGAALRIEAGMVRFAPQ